MIRQATAADIPLIVEMGRRFVAASGSPIPFTEDGASAFAEALIASPDAALLVSDTGMIGGVIAPAYFNPAWRMAVELAWWAEDRSGLQLLSAFEAWARDMGAQEVRMTTLAAIQGPERILARRGYAPTEISFQKVI